MSSQFHVYVTGESLESQRDRLPKTLATFPVEWISLPVLRFERLPVPPEVIRRTVEEPFGWVLFSSPRAVHFWSETLIELQTDFPIETQVACMGEGTAAAAELDGFTPDFFPTEPGTEGFLAEFEALVANNLDKPSVLIPAAETGRTAIKDALETLGCEVVRFALYRTLPREDLDEVVLGLRIAPENSILIFTSPSSVDAVLDRVPIRSAMRVVAIGEFTAERLRARDVDPLLLPAGDIHRLEEIL